MAAHTFPEEDAQIAPLLVVADLQRSLHFYIEQIGATALTVWDTYAMLQIGAGRLHLATPSPSSYDKPGISLIPPPDWSQLSGEVVISVADCRQVYVSLRARGVVFMEPPSNPDWGGETRCFVQDPDGHLIEFSQTDLPADERR